MRTAIHRARFCWAASSEALRPTCRHRLLCQALTLHGAFRWAMRQSDRMLNRRYFVSCFTFLANIATPASASIDPPLLSFSYGPASDLYKADNPAFAEKRKKETRETIDLQTSYGGSGEVEYGRCYANPRTAGDAHRKFLVSWA